MLDVFGSERHYLDHLLPIVAELREEARVFTSGGLAAAWEPARAAGAQPGLPPAGTSPVMVASYGDELLVRATSGRPIIFLEHGAGQDYGGGHGAHPGGPGREDVILFVCPNASVAERNRAVYPNAAIAVVGCPKLDPWHRGERGPAPLEGRDPVVAFAFHWDCHVTPEARTAFYHFAGELELVARTFPGALGHGHPRIVNELAPAYARAGLEPVFEFADVLDRADVLAFDNTSAGFEFASTGRPVVVLNAPGYRRNVDLGLRFWRHIPGVMVDEPADLVPALRLALEDPPELRELRESAAAAVYDARDGAAAIRAARAVEAILGGGERCRD
jgi:hypothetical protein